MSMDNCLKTGSLTKNSDENKPSTSKAYHDAKAGAKRKDNIQENKRTKRQKHQNGNKITEDLLPYASVVKLHAIRLGITEGMSVDEIGNKIIFKFGDSNVFEPICLPPFHFLFFEFGKASRNKFLIPLQQIPQTNNQVANEGEKTSGTLIVWYRKREDGAPDIFCVYKGTAYNKIIRLADSSFRTTIAKCCLDQNYLKQTNYITVAGPDITVRRINRTEGMFDHSLDVFERVYTDLEGQVIQDCKLHQIISNDSNQRKKINIAIGQYKVRILFPLNYFKLSEILSHFSDLCKNGFAQTDNFSSLDMVKKVDEREIIKKLNKKLLTTFLDSIKDDENSGGLSLSHNHIEDWVLSSEIILLLDKERNATWYSTPSISEVKQKLNIIFVDARTLRQNLKMKTIQIKFQKKNEDDYDCKPLQSFLHGTCTLDGDDQNYYKIAGKWFQFTVEYSEKINEKFSKLKEKLSRDNQTISSLLLPWSHKPKITLENFADFFNLPEKKAEELMELFEDEITFTESESNISTLEGFSCWLIESSVFFKNLKKDGFFKLDKRRTESKKFLIEQIISESSKKNQDLLSLLKEKKLQYVHQIMCLKTCLLQKQSPESDFWTVVNPNVPAEVLDRIKEEFPEIEEISADRLTLFFRSFSLLNENEYNCNYLMHHNRAITTIYGDKVLVKNVELFDVLIHDHANNTTYLLHVKQGFGYTIRDACSQIRISSQYIWSSAFKHKSQNSFVNLFWKTAMDYNGYDGRRHVLKEKLEKIGKENFLGFFDQNVQIVFVLAFMDEKEDKMSRDIESTIAKMEILYLNNHFKKYISDGGYSFQLQVCQIPSEFK